jgi:hypothetical protein
MREQPDRRPSEPAHEMEVNLNGFLPAQRLHLLLYSSALVSKCSIHYLE